MDNRLIPIQQLPALGPRRFRVGDLKITIKVQMPFLEVGKTTTSLGEADLVVPLDVALETLKDELSPRPGTPAESSSRPASRPARTAPAR